MIFSSFWKLKYHILSGQKVSNDTEKLLFHYNILLLKFSVKWTEKKKMVLIIANVFIFVFFIWKVDHYKS